MSAKSLIVTGSVFYFVFLLLTPLGIFSDWISPIAHTGYYSVATIDGGDDAGYYAYLRSVFFDGDLDFINERDYAHAEKLTPTGYIFNNWQMGQAFLFFPFFLVGHLLALLYQTLGYPVAADGYSAPYYIATAVASASWLFIGLVFVQRLLEKFVSGRIALIASLSLWLTSPLLYFTFIRQRMAHTVEFAMAALFLLAWMHCRKSKDLYKYAILGAVLGLLCMIRVLGIAYFALFAVDLLVLLWLDKSDFLAERMKALVIRLSVFTGGFLLLMLPQLLIWYKLNGVPLPPRHLHFAGQGLSGFSVTAFLDNLSTFLWGPRWGLIYSMPLAAAGFFGLFMKTEFLKDARPAMLAYLLGLTGIIVLYPEDSASYGHRHLIAALPVFAVGLARLLQGCSEKRGGWFLMASIVSFCVLAQYLMIAQYKVSLPYNHEQFTIKALTSIPQLILDHPGQLLRSTNFFRLMFMDRPPGIDYNDVLFTMVFPLLQLVSIGLIVVFFSCPVGRNGLGGIFSSSRAVFWAGVFTSIVLMGIVGMAAPAKSPEEIQKRKTYFNRMREGDALLTGGNIVHARAAYEESAQLIPGLWNPYFKIGATWNIQGNLERANSFYAKGLALNPMHTVALTNYGSNLNFLGQFEEAENKLKAAIRSWPFNKNAYDALAQVYVRINKPEQARDQLLMALVIDPNYGPGHANLAVVYTILKQGTSAVAHLNQAVALGIKGPAIDQLLDIYQKEKPGR